MFYSISYVISSLPVEVVHFFTNKHTERSSIDCEKFYNLCTSKAVNAEKLPQCCFVMSNCAEIHPMLTAKKPATEKQNRRAGGTIAASSKSSSKSGSKSHKVDTRPKHKAVEMLKENAI